MNLAIKHTVVVLQIRFDDDDKKPVLDWNFMLHWWDICGLQISSHEIIDFFLYFMDHHFKREIADRYHAPTWTSNIVYGAHWIWSRIELHKSHEFLRMTSQFIQPWLGYRLFVFLSLTWKRLNMILEIYFLIKTVYIIKIR